MGSFVGSTLAVVLAVLAAGPAAPPAVESVRAHFERREFEAALAESRALLSRAEAGDGPESLAAAEALEWMARVLSAGRLGERGEALVAAERALAITRKRVGKADSRLAFALYVVGLAHYLGGDAPGALAPFEQALRTAEAIEGPSRPDLEWYVREYGAALYSAGRYADALREFERLSAISREKHGAGQPGTVPALYNLALVRDVMGELDEAERLYQEALMILRRQQPPDLDKIASTLDAHSGLLARQGRLGEALSECERVIEMRRGRLGPDSPELAQTLVVQGRMLWMVGDYEGSRRTLRKSIEILRTAEPTSVLYSAHLNLATLSRLENDLPAARAALTEVRRAGLAAGLPEGHPLWFGYHAEYGEVLTRQGERAEARAQLALGLTICGATMGERHYDYAATLASLGRLDLDDGHALAARERLERALEILGSELSRQQPLHVETEQALAEALYALERDQPAFTRSLDADKTRRELERATMAVLPERQALAQAIRPRDGRDLALAIALSPGAPAERRTAVYDALIRSRAVVFDELASRQRALRSGTDERTRSLLDELREAKSRLAGVLVQGSATADRVRAAREQVESADAELARASASYRARVAEREFGADGLQRALPKHSACLSYVLYQRPSGRSRNRVPSYAALVWRSGAPAPSVVDLGPAREIGDAVSRWRAALDPVAVVRPGAEARYRDAAGELRAKVWDPVAAHLEGAALLFVVPDGDLNLVNLAGLPVAESAYLLERGPTFHYLTAERDLAAGPRSGEGRGLLALGNPAFEDPAALAYGTEAFRGHTPGCESFRATRFGPLPAAAVEVEAVKAIWAARPGAGPVTLLAGAAASELAFKRQAPGKQALHLATHGFFLGEDCGAAGAFRGIGGVSPRKTAPDGAAMDDFESPLLLSGLALAGANRRAETASGAEDGILTAEEVSAVDLAGVRLAVLSACRTGAGRIASGEGVFGLRRAFLVAGAATVVTNLWDVDDRAGQAWIESFYRERLVHGRSIPESVRRASLALSADRRSDGRSAHPFYWAGWLAVGEPN